MTSLELLERAMVDPLTGAAATQGFHQRCEAEFDRAQRLRLRLSVLAVHADSLHPSSDHGFPASDPLVRTLGVFLLASLRGSDILGRRPGGGFAIVLSETGLSGAITLAERLQSSVGRIVTRAGDRTIPLTVTIAASTLRPGAESLESAILEAEALLVRGREEGGDRILISD